jgi:uncharacterized protein YoxC
MKYKLKKKYGGGGGTTVTNETIPAWARPYMENVGKTAEASYQAGDLGKVAGTSTLQEQAFGEGASGLSRATQMGLESLEQQNQRLSGMATTPSAATLAAQKEAVVQDAQKKVAGLNTAFGQSGTLGSARQAVMQGAQNAATTAELAKVDADYENKMFQNRLSAEQALQQGATTASNIATGGASGLANLGSQQRTIEQQGLDADWQALQRYASTIYGNPSRQQTTAVGGK